MTEDLALYQGFEQGPIRPPSEARSLLVRVTRNCPWNKCAFCPVYKGRRFSVRPVDHVKYDIDSVNRHVHALRQMADESGNVSRFKIREYTEGITQWEFNAFQATINWMFGGMKSVFIQDANSLIVKPTDLVEILQHLKSSFPWVERITSYARSHTIARISDADLKAIGDAGLNRIHIGLESGSDKVLETVNKGVDKETHILAGIKVMTAGIELSEYVMPGLGGRKYSRIHATETADALNRINPDFIRLRTLAIPDGLQLAKDYERGEFERLSDRDVAREILEFVENLEGVTSVLQSDHILNLFEDVEGRLPADKPRMLGVLRDFLEMTPEDQCIYQVGRRLGIFAGSSDLKLPGRLEKVRGICSENGITPDNVDAMTQELTKKFI